MGVTAVTLISLLQEYVAKYGDDTEVAVAAHLSLPMRQELMGVAADREVRRPDEQPPLDPPLLWLITGAPAPGVDPYAPRYACIPRVYDPPPPRDGEPI
jgi:hypothetical protein